VLLYLKLDLKTTDIEKISSQPYRGSYEYAQFFTNKGRKQINVILFDENRKKVKTEQYYFIPTIIKTTDTYFLNLTGMQRDLSWNTIETVLIK
jgi:hypothetical protein